MDFRNRIKNYGLWIAVAAFLPLAFEALGDYGIFWVLPGNYDKLITALLLILVLAGIINNPASDNHGYADDE